MIIALSAAAVGFFLAGPALDGVLSANPSFNFLTNIPKGVEIGTAVAMFGLAHLLIR